MCQQGALQPQAPIYMCLCVCVCVRVHSLQGIGENVCL